MFKGHGFEIPYMQLVSDKKEVIKFIATLIYKDHTCIQCESSGFKFSRAVLSHIIEKRHYYLYVDLFEDEYLNFISDKRAFKLSRTPFSHRVVLENPGHLTTIESSETSSHKLSNAKEDDEGWEDEGEMINEKADQLAAAEVEPIMLSNGNLVMSDGRVVDNKAYL